MGSVWAACTLESKPPIPLVSWLLTTLSLCVFPELVLFTSILQDVEARVLLRYTALAVMGDLGLSPNFASCYLVVLRQISLSLSFLICETRSRSRPTGLLRGS